MHWKATVGPLIPSRLPSAQPLPVKLIWPIPPTSWAPGHLVAGRGQLPDPEVVALLAVGDGERGGELAALHRDRAHRRPGRGAGSRPAARRRCRSSDDGRPGARAARDPGRGGGARRWWGRPWSTPGPPRSGPRRCSRRRRSPHRPVTGRAAATAVRRRPHLWSHSSATWFPLIPSWLPARHPCPRELDLAQRARRPRPWTPCSRPPAAPVLPERRGPVAVGHGQRGGDPAGPDRDPADRGPRRQREAGRQVRDVAAARGGRADRRLRRVQLRADRQRRRRLPGRRVAVVAAAGEQRARRRARTAGSAAVRVVMARVLRGSGRGSVVSGTVPDATGTSNPVARVVGVVGRESSRSRPMHPNGRLTWSTRVPDARLGPFPVCPSILVSPRPRPAAPGSA